MPQVLAERKRYYTHRRKEAETQMKVHRALTSVLALAVVAGLASAQDAPKKKAPPASPPAETSTAIGGKTVTIKYSAPSVRGRKIFGQAPALLPDNTVWRAGANNATALHTDGDIAIGNLNVPAGDYTLYVFLDPKGWQLIVSRQTGQWGIGPNGTSLDESKAIGRTPMKMSKPATLVETYKMSLLAGEGKKGLLTLEWENVSASVDITAK
jgi:hypothetical protein